MTNVIRRMRVACFWSHFASSFSETGIIFLPVRNLCDNHITRYCELQANTFPLKKIFVPILMIFARFGRNLT